MEVTSGPAKRSRAKSKDAPAPKTQKPVVVTKKPRASRKVVAPVMPEPAAVTCTASVRPAAEALDLDGMIATAAYFLAAERHFHPGRELDDWLEAERRIRASYYG